MFQMPIMNGARDYHDLLVANKSNEPVTLYIYSNWDSACWLSKISKIIESGNDYLYREEMKFKYQLYIRKDQLTDVKKWQHNVHIEVAVDRNVREDALSNHETEHKIMVTHHEFKSSLIQEGKNFDHYAILGLSMKEIREMKKDEQTTEIKDAYRRTMLIYGRDDQITGNVKIAQDVVFAYSVLIDPESRIKYHNTVDHKGCWWKIWKRLKAVYWPDSFDSKGDRIKNLLKRLSMTAGSLILFGAGIGIAVVTVGSASLPIIIMRSVLSFGLFTGATFSGTRSLQLECGAVDYVKTFALGFIGGALAGGISALAVVEIGGVGVPLASMSVVQQIAIGSISGVAGGITKSLASDAIRKLVDKECITVKEVIGHAFCGAITGLLAGLAGAAVASKLGGIAETFADEAVAIAALRRIGIAVGKKTLLAFIKSGISNLIDSSTNFVMERLDVEIGNREFTECFKDMAEAIVKDVIKASGKTVVAGAVTEIKSCGGKAGTVTEIKSCGGNCH